MKTITLRKALECRPSDNWIKSYCAHFNMAEVKTLNDLAKLPNDELDAERSLAGYLSAETLQNVIWAIQALSQNWSVVAVDFARGCAKSAASLAEAYKGIDNEMFEPTYYYADYADLADDAANKTSHAVCACSAPCAVLAARDASAASNSAGWAAAGFNGGRAERARQVEHLRELLS